MTAPKLTPAQAAWLRKLKVEGPQKISVLFRDFPGAYECLKAGWTEWSGDPFKPESITPDGLAALAEHEKEVPL